MSYSENTTAPAATSGTRTRAERLILLAGWASISVAVTLLLAKLVAWFMTGSVGVLAALVDSLLDLLASVINLIAIRYAMVPPDDEHKFGHGKAEALAGLGQSTFIASSALFLFVFSVERIVNPELIVELTLGSAVMGLSLILTALLVSFQRYVVNKTGSVAIKADSLHYSADFLSNSGVLLGLALYYWGWLYADPIIALLIAVFIFKSALEIGHESVQLLLDRELPMSEQEKIDEIAASYPGVIEVHDIRTRRSGPTKFIQLHLVMDGNMTLSAAHALSDEVESALRAEFEGADILIHQDPHTEREGPSDSS